MDNAYPSVMESLASALFGYNKELLWGEKTRFTQFILFCKELFDLCGAYIIFCAPPKYSARVLAYSLLITFHPKMIEEKEKIRASLRLPIYKYNMPLSDINLLCLLEQPGVWEKRMDLERMVEEVLTKFNLQEEWSLPLKIKVLTGVLPTLTETLPLFFTNYYFPQLESPKAFNMPPGMEKCGEFIGFRTRKYPCLVITEAVRPETIVKYVREKWKEEIEEKVEKLPKRFLAKIDLERFSFGTWLLDSKDNERLNWNEIIDEIDKLDEADEHLFNAFDGPPSRIDCQKIYDETKNYFMRFCPY